MTLTCDRLRELVIYYPDSGKFIRRTDGGRFGRFVAGSEPGWFDNRGYHRLQIDGVNYWGHRLACLYMTGRWPIGDIDHIDGNCSNNKWNNLRFCTDSENLCNRGPQRNNTTGLKGVVPMRNKFQAQICIRGDRHHLGTFETALEAHEVYCKKADELHGEFKRIS